MAKRLTIQQRKLLSGLIEGKTLTEAGQEAGYFDKSSAHRASTSVNFNEAMKAALARAGISDDALAGKIKELLDAEKPYGKEGAMGPDNPVRLGAVDMAIKIGGGYAPTKNELAGPDGKPIKADITLPSAQQLMRQLYAEANGKKRKG